MTPAQIANLREVCARLRELGADLGPEGARLLSMSEECNALAASAERVLIRESLRESRS